MSISFISRFTIALILGAMATSTVAAADNSFIGPKGGDTRKGVYSSSSSQEYANGYGATCGPSVFIGPKGGDTRKGVYGSACVACDTVSAQSFVAMDHQDVGPKGGPTSKGQYRSSI